LVPSNPPGLSRILAFAPVEPERICLADALGAFSWQDFIAETWKQSCDHEDTASSMSIEQCLDVFAQQVIIKTTASVLIVNGPAPNRSS
jgi:hypothetical protein